jgi:hypothetical protein
MIALGALPVFRYPVPQNPCNLIEGTLVMKVMAMSLFIETAQREIF